MIIFNYPSKKAIQENIGEPLNYTETSFFGNEFPEDGNGTILGCNRPYSPEYPYFFERAFDGIKKDGSPKKAKEYFANVTVKDGLIVSVK
jgi:hypothetical protein